MTDFPKFKLNFPGENVRMRIGPTPGTADDHDLPDIRLKTLVTFPASVRGGVAVDVTQANGVYTFDLDYGEIARVSTVAVGVRPTTFFLLWESTTNSFSRINLADFKALLASMP